jgi:hypothetical protein
MSLRSAPLVAVVVTVVGSAVVAVVVSVATTAVAIVVVAANDVTERLAALEPEISSDPQPQPANSNTRSARGTGDVSADAERAIAAEPVRKVVEVPKELAELAASIGQAWSQDYVAQLQAQERDIIGAWPGTIREARRHVLARIKLKLEPEQLDQLARLTNLAARRGWETVSEPDLES